MGTKATFQGWLRLALGLGVALLLISTVLPWLAENGYAGHVIQENVRTDRDASALFYTEDDRTWEVLDALPVHERKSQPEGDSVGE